jgi:hypothetical protein
VTSFDPRTLEAKCACGHEIVEHARNKRQDRTENC